MAQGSRSEGQRGASILLWTCINLVSRANRMILLLFRVFVALMAAAAVVGGTPAMSRLKENDENRLLDPHGRFGDNSM